MKKRSKASRKRISSLLFLMTFTAILLIASTYAWFTTQKNVSISNLKGVVEVADGMEISLDAQNWDTTINLDDAAIVKKAYNNHMNIYPTELLPVSTIGETVDTEGNGDRLNMVRGSLDELNFTGITACDETKENYIVSDNAGLAALDDDIAINEADYPAYFAFDLFVRNTSRGKSTDGTETNNLQLDKTSLVRILENSFTNPTNSREYTGDAESGLQNCVRVGFAMYEATEAATASQSTILDKLVTTPNTISQVSIWEPNANAHVSYIVTNNNKVKTDADNGGLDPKAAVSPKLFKATSNFFTFGIKKDTESVSEIYDWATPSEGLAKQATVQTKAPTYNITDEGEDNTVYPLGKVYNLTTAEETPKNFTIAANQISRMRIYLWLEGQDVDCINWASFGGGIEAVIGLTKDETTDLDTALTPSI